VLLDKRQTLVGTPPPHQDKMGAGEAWLRVRDDRDHGFQMIVIIHSRAAHGHKSP
jgi:hypothetical protein